MRRLDARMFRKSLPALVFVGCMGASAMLVRPLLDKASGRLTSKSATPETDAWAGAKDLEIVGASDGVFDLGSQPRGILREFRLVAENASPHDTLEIARIGSTCTCTAPQVDSLRIAPNETVEIPFTIALPENQAEWRVSLDFHLKGGARKRLSMEMALPPPFPERALVADDGSLLLPLADLYHGKVAQVKCYAHGREDVIAAHLAPAGDAVAIDAAPEGVKTLDLVLTTENPGHTSGRVVQYVQLDDL